MNTELSPYTASTASKWELLVELEPKLKELYHLKEVWDEVWTLTGGEPTPTGSGEPGWYNHLKPHMQQLVGGHRPDYHPILSSGQAYRVAYQALLEAIPPRTDKLPWWKQ